MITFSLPAHAAQWFSSAGDGDKLARFGDTRRQTLLPRLRFSLLAEFVVALVACSLQAPCQREASADFCRDRSYRMPRLRWAAKRPRQIRDFASASPGRRLRRY